MTLLSVAIIFLSAQSSLAFVPRATQIATWFRTEVAMGSNRFNREFEESSRQRAQSGAAETAAGIILGGLIGGPFGAVFGAQLGASMGASRAIDKARQDEMQRLGITPDMLQIAEEVGKDLERAIEGLKASRDSLETQQSFARKLSANADELYKKAKDALNEAQEEVAKKYLFERQQLQKKLKRTLTSCVEEKKRLETMERNILLLEDRAMEIESLLRRSVGARTLQDTGSDFALPTEDPLLKKFRDAGID
jgi:hypothetical protein